VIPNARSARQDPASPRFPALGLRWALTALVAALAATGSAAHAAKTESAAVAAAQSQACPDGVCPGLGHAFYLPGINGFNLESAGNDFFLDTRIGGCARMSPLQEKTTREFQSSENMEQLTRNTMTSFDLKASYSTARLSANASLSKMTGVDSTTTQRVSSTHMDITTPTRYVDFVQRQSDCLTRSNIHPTDLEAFESLQLIDPEHVGEDSQWKPYEDYLQNLGSHILVRLQYGSRFQRWESSSQSTEDLLKTLKIKACTAVEGKNPDKKGWSVDSCGDYSREQREKAAQTDSEWRQIVMGGSKEAREALTDAVTEANITAFIRTSSLGDRPIGFGFKPVWELWTRIYAPLCKAHTPSTACDNLQRAYNLRIAYEGRLAIGCPTWRNEDGFVYQTMGLNGKPNSQGLQLYGCFAERTGCRSNLDCRKGGAFGVCYCWGNTCLDQGAPIVGTGQFRTRIRGSEEGSYNQGVNNSCRFSPGIGSTCGCNTTWSGGLKRRDLFLPSLSPHAPVRCARGNRVVARRASRSGDRASGVEHGEAQQPASR